jgi:hypothetical protein
MICNWISYIIITMMIIYIYSTENSNQKIFACTLLLIFMFYYYVYLWSQMFNVYPSKQYKTQKKYKKKVLWINTNVLQIQNPKHKQWARHVLLDSAPNKLGIYIDHPSPDKVFVSRQIETFKIMFHHNPSRIYFSKSCDNEVSDFCRKKKMSLLHFPFRFTT